MAKNNNFWKYFRQYEVSQIVAMIKNNGKDPTICTDRFDNKLVVISGATSGIGKVTALKFAAMGADLLCINRNKEKSETLKQVIEAQYEVSCNYMLADLGNISEIRKVADELQNLGPNIDVLIHNAGIHLTKQQLTEEGLDKVYVVNYLSSFIINYTLIEKLNQQKKARIIMNNSEGHRFAAWGLRLDDLNWTKRRYSGLKAYGSAKLAQLLSMHVFKEKFEGSQVTINSMHPGAVESATGKENGAIYKWYKKNILGRFLRSTEIAAESMYYLGVSQEMEGVSGKFYNLTTEEIPAPPAWDVGEAKKLWDISLEQSGLVEK